MAAAAAVVALILGITLTWGGGSEPRPAPPATPTPVPTTTPVPGEAALTGDVDGDEIDDTVTLVDRELRVQRSATGEVLTRRVRGRHALAGLADVDADRLAIVLDSLEVLAVRKDRIAPLRTDGRHLFATDGRTIWVDDQQRLLDGAFVADDADPVTVVARRWVVREDGVLGPVTADRHCWDRDTQPTPLPCSPASWVGDADGLPPLQPELTNFAPLGEPVVAGGGVRAVLDGPPEVAENYDHAGLIELVVTAPAGEQRVPLAGPGIPGVRAVPGTTSFLVRQDSEHFQDWSVVAPVDGRYAVLGEPGDIPLDGQWIGDFERVTWLTEGGGIFTRETLAAFGIHRAWAWEVDGDRVVPVDLGRVCLDDTTDPPAYGSC